MKSYATHEVRNVCLLGAQGDGKTSVAEALLFNAKVTNRLGTIDQGSTVCDNTEEEIARKISISLSLSFLEHKDKKVNLLVTPGYGDFIGEVYSGLSVAEAGIFVVSADSGVSPVAENLWELVEEKKMPSMIFLNKLDKENINFEQLIGELKEKLHQQIAVINIPNATGQGFTSVTNVLDGANVDKTYKDSLVEIVSAADDALTEKYLEGKEISSEELRITFVRAIKERKVFPLLCGSATKNIGIAELADFITNYIPAPEQPADNAHFSALVCKTISEPGMGHLNFIKVYSGSVEHGRDIYNFTRNTRERVGQMCFVQGKKKVDTTTVSPGDIVGLLKLKETRTNEVLGDEKIPPALKLIEFPEAVYKKAIVTTSKGEAEKVGNALSIVTIEDPTIHYKFDAETKEMVASGMGALQLEIMKNKMKTRYNVEVELKPPRIPYKETIHGKAEVQGKYKRQSGGRGQYGDCWIRIANMERGAGFEFLNKIVGGAIPKNYIPAIEKGVKEAMDNGVIAGYPVVDVQATVFDGSYHEVDSSDMAFKIAGAMALRKAVAEARPGILEPIFNMEITVPDGYMGAIMGDLNSRRGRVMGMEKKGKKQLVKAQVPLGEVFEYATDLRSLTKGSGKFSMNFSHYEDAPPPIAQPLIDTFAKARTEDSEK